MRCATALRTPWSGAASPWRKARAGRYFTSACWPPGGFVHSLLRRFLPQGPAKDIFTWSVTPTLGPVHMDLLVVSITLGPIGLDVSLLALVGVAIAYYVARSIF